MTPVLTVDEMQAVDASAPEPLEVLVGRAGFAVARAALAMLGGGYGRRVVVLAGPGNNGDDGRHAGALLRRRGVRTIEVDATAAPAHLPACDLVIDAAFGTGLSRPFEAPDPGGTPVLAIDIPSGVRGDDGQLLGRPMPATRTVTFAALKPGLLFGDGPHFVGEIELADIGLDASRATIHVVDDRGAAAMVPVRNRSAHKWDAAVLLVAGSAGMPGAAAMAAEAAQRAGAGMVVIAPPGVQDRIGPVESVTAALPESGWAEAILDGAAADLERIDALVIGPGLGTAMSTRHEIRELVRRAPVPLVVDGDALTAVGADAGDLVGQRHHTTVLTPHDGEFARLAGGPPGHDRVAAARALAADAEAVVLLKGPSTVVARPDGAVRVVTSGDERLATAGTGDVLAGTIAALLAGGASGFDAASAGAHVHGVAGSRCPDPGTVASDVIRALPGALAQIGAGA